MSYAGNITTCPACGTATKLLLSGRYCPKDCDLGPRPVEATLKFTVGDVYWVVVSEKRTRACSREMYYEARKDLNEYIFVVAPAPELLRDLPGWAVGVQQAVYTGKTRVRGCEVFTFAAVLDPDAFLPRPAP